MADFQSDDPHPEPIRSTAARDEYDDRAKDTPRSPGAAQGIAAVIVLIALAITVYIVLS